MSNKENKYKVNANKKYKITFGVKQTEEINKAANSTNETPVEFIKKSALEATKDMLS
jgi:uncharacterized protein (DUF1778 family)